MWLSRPRAPIGARRRSLAAILAICAAAGPGSPSASASAPSAENQTRLDRTVRFLQEVQNPDGGFGGVRGGQSDPDFSAWVALALAAAGVNPQDQAQPAGVDVYAYLAQHAPELSLTTDFERVLLVVDASGTSAHSFGGVDLLGGILERQLPDGSFSHVPAGQPAINDTIFAILALSPISEPAAAAAVQRAATWLEAQQIADGSWSSNCPRTVPNCSPQPEVDMTGAAIEALNAAGRHRTHAQLAAFKFLHDVQNPDAGFPETPSEEESNVASTAWGAQGIWSAGQDPEAWRIGAGNPLGYMASLQQSDGSIRWKVSEDSIPVWMTAYVAPAFAGRALPIATVPRALRTDPPASGPSVASAVASGAGEVGQGGESAGQGGGVIAGGGGGGAPLFSRPQPQSRGRVRGGARALSEPRERASAGRRAHPASPPHPVGATGEEGKPASAGSAVGGSAERVPAPALSQRGGDQHTESSGATVNGVLIGVSKDAHGRRAKVAGAPGLHGAGAGGSQASWPSIAIAAAIVLLTIAGSQLERRRPQAVL